MLQDGPLLSPNPELRSTDEEDETRSGKSGMEFLRLALDGQMIYLFFQNADTWGVTSSFQFCDFPLLQESI